MKTQLLNRLRRKGIASAIVVKRKEGRASTARPPRQSVPATAFPMLDRTLSSIPLAALQDPASRKLVISSMWMEEYKPGATLIEIDESSDHLFVVAQGTASLTVR